MPLFKLAKSGGPRDFEVSMAGLKLGSRVLQIGAGDGPLIAALAAAAGLSGRACALAPDRAAAAEIETAAARTGVLVEIAVGPSTALPYDPDSFDLVVVKDALGGMRPNDRVASLQQAHRVLRAGGRCLVIERALRGGLGALFSRQALDRRYAAGGARTALAAEGFRGVRILSERDGVRFTEGTKPPPPAESETA